MRQWLSALQWGAARRAWELMVGANPLPACMGRICYAPCESGCVLATRRMDGGAVGIKGLEGRGGRAGPARRLGAGGAGGAHR